MASIVRRGSKWYANYKDAAGMARQKALPSAITKTEARRLADELEQKSWRQRSGLDPLPFESTMTLGELGEWWLRERCPSGSRYNETKRLGHHVINAPLGRLPLPVVSTAALEDKFCKMERAGLGPDSINRGRTPRPTPSGGRRGGASTPLLRRRRWPWCWPT